MSKMILVIVIMIIINNVENDISNSNYDNK